MTGSDGVDPALSIDETGRPHLTWIEDNGVAGVQVRYARRISGAWTSAKLVGEGRHQALSVDKPGTPWVVTGGDEVTGVVYASGWFQSIPIDEDGAFGVAVKVLDSGDVVVAWAGGDPLGLWVSHNLIIPGSLRCRCQPGGSNASRSVRSIRLVMSPR